MIDTSRTPPSQKWLRDEDGNLHWLCRQCEGPLPPRRSSYCSDACSEAFNFRWFQSFIRPRVFERDRGVCALCHLDTVLFLKHVQGARWTSHYQSDPLKARHRSSWWEADHIVPVIEGGGDLGLDNIRTLCVPCHKTETATLAARRAAARRPPDLRMPLFPATQEVA